jgi:cytochrome c551/c552
VKCAVTLLLLFLSQASGTATKWDKDLTVFIEESCVACHDAETDTRLDLTSLGLDLQNENIFRPS